MWLRFGHPTWLRLGDVIWLPELVEVVCVRVLVEESPDEALIIRDEELALHDEVRLKELFVRDLTDTPAPPLASAFWICWNKNVGFRRTSDSELTFGAKGAQATNAQQSSSNSRRAL